MKQARSTGSQRQVAFGVFAAFLVLLFLGAGFGVTESNAASWAPGTNAKHVERSAGVSANYKEKRFWWQSRRITYHDGTGFLGKAIKQAAAAWNKSGVKIKWVATSRRKADVPIEIAPFPPMMLGYASATVTQNLSGNIIRRRDMITLSKVLRYPRNAGKDSPELQLATKVVVHEMGHVLGLDHDDRICATMNSLINESCPTPPKPYQYYCRLLEKDDLKGAVRILGGRVKPVRGPRFCEIKSKPAPAVTNFSVKLRQPDLWDDDFTFATFRWKVPSSRSLGGLIITWGGANRPCESNPARTPSSRKMVVAPNRPGKTQTSYWEWENGSMAPGSQCFRVFSSDQYGRAGKSVKATAILNQPPPPTPDPWEEEYPWDY